MIIKKPKRYANGTAYVDVPNTAKTDAMRGDAKYGIDSNNSLKMQAEGGLATAAGTAAFGPLGGAAAGAISGVKQKAINDVNRGATDDFGVYNSKGDQIKDMYAKSMTITGTAENLVDASKFALGMETSQDKAKQRRDEYNTAVQREKDRAFASTQVGAYDEVADLNKSEVVGRSYAKGTKAVYSQGSKYIEIESKEAPEIHTDKNFNLKNLGTKPHSKGGTKVLANDGDIVFPTQNSKSKFKSVMGAIAKGDVSKLESERSKLPKDGDSKVMKFGSKGANTYQGGTKHISAKQARMLQYQADMEDRNKKAYLEKQASNKKRDAEVASTLKAREEAKAYKPIIKSNPYIPSEKPITNLIDNKIKQTNIFKESGGLGNNYVHKPEAISKLFNSTNVNKPANNVVNKPTNNTSKPVVNKAIVKANNTPVDNFETRRQKEHIKEMKAQDGFANSPAGEAFTNDPNYKDPNSTVVSTNSTNNGTGGIKPIRYKSKSSMTYQGEVPYPLDRFGLINPKVKAGVLPSEINNTKGSGTVGNKSDRFTYKKLPTQEVNESIRLDNDNFTNRDEVGLGGDPTLNLQLDTKDDPKAPKPPTDKYGKYTDAAGAAISALPAIYNIAEGTKRPDKTIRREYNPELLNYKDYSAGAQRDSELMARNANYVGNTNAGGSLQNMRANMTSVGNAMRGQKEQIRAAEANKLNSVNLTNVGARNTAKEYNIKMNDQADMFDLQNRAATQKYTEKGLAEASKFVANERSLKSARDAQADNKEYLTELTSTEKAKQDYYKGASNPTISKPVR